jgi:hypothetical protein
MMSGRVARFSLRNRSKLIADGRSSADSDRVINEILRVMGSDSERGRTYERLFYNKVYRATKAIFDEGPNKLLVETVESLQPGKALDIAMGQGRNAVFLATRGWDVTGFDIAEEGLQKAAAKANQLGVRLRVVKASVEDFDWGTTQRSHCACSRRWAGCSCVARGIHFSQSSAPERDPVAHTCRLVRRDGTSIGIRSDRAATIRNEYRGPRGSDEDRLRLARLLSTL